MSEKELQSTIVQAAQARGWMVYHVSDSRWVYPRPRFEGDELSGRGFPDLLLLKPPHMCFFECKSQQGVVSKDQKRWLERLRKVGDVMVGVVRPADLGSVMDYLETPEQGNVSAI